MSGVTSAKVRAGRSTAALISVLVTALAAIYLFSDISADDVLSLIRNIDPAYAGAFAAASLTAVIIRTLRYRILLAVAGYTVPLAPLALITLVRNLCIDLLPARLGGAAYIYLVHSRLGVPLAAGTASFGLEILLDLGAVAVILAVLPLINAESDGGQIVRTVAVAAASGFAALAALVAAPPALNRVARMLPIGRLAVFFKSLAEDIGRFRHAGILGRLFLLSLIIRALKYLGLYLLLCALLIPHQISLPAIGASLAGLIAAEFAATLPTSGIAGFGAYEGVFALIFSRIGLEPQLAKATAVAHHLLTQIWGYTLGLIALPLLYALRTRRSA